MAKNPPYLASPGTLTTAFKKVKEAKTPERFTRDFLNIVLQMKGGSAKAIIPFFKRIGFLNPDGTPTSLYERFRNEGTEGAAAAEALRTGYSALFDVNEHAHELTDRELKGIIVQVTGAEKESSTIDKTLRTFKKLRDFADFDEPPTAESAPVTPPTDYRTDRTPTHRFAPQQRSPAPSSSGIGLSYTINIQLPATTNIEVFHAIFRSLREHLMDQ